MERPTTENGRVCLVEVRAKGTKRTPQFHGAGGTATSGAQGGTTKILQVGWSKAKQTPSDQGSDPEYDPLL